MLAPPTKVRKLVLTLACSLSFLLYLHRYSWGLIKPDLQKEFGWDHRTMAFLDNCFVGSYGIGQIPSGMLCDWIGARVLLGSGVLIWSLALCGFALAATWQWFAASRILFGAAQAGCYPTLGKVSKSWFPIRSRSTAQGLIATFFGRGGGAVCFIVFGTVLTGTLKVPWRYSLVLFSAIGVVCGIAFVLLFRNTPREHPWVNEAEIELIQAGEDPAIVSTSVHSRLRWSTLFASGGIWFLLFRAFMSNVADVLYVYWIPTYLRNVRHLDEGNTGWIAALPLVGGALGGIASGLIQTGIIRKTGNRRWARSGVGFAGKGLAAALMLASITVPNVYVLAGLLLLVKFFSDWEQPAEWGAITDMAGRNAATIFAFINTVGAIGGLLGGMMIGHVLQWLKEGGPSAVSTITYLDRIFFGTVASNSELTSWNAIFVLTAVEYLLAALAWFFIDSRKTLEPTLRTV